MRPLSIAAPLSRLSVPRFAAVLAVTLGAVLAGTWLAVSLTTDYLLYKDATSTARKWAHLLAASVHDLEQIASGQLPSSDSMRFFEWARSTGQVFRYEIYNREGYSQLVSEEKIVPVNISQFSAEALRALTTGEPVVSVEESAVPDRPTYFARAYVPVLVDGAPVAIVAAFVDQSDKRALFRDTFLIAAAGLCLLTGFAFTSPAIALYRRTKEKQQAERRIRFLAHHDALTGLPNRATLVEALDRGFRTLSQGDGFAVLFIDVDRFKEVNDSLGHDGGDFLLKTVAARLLAVSRAEDVVARLGGDEFVVVQSGASETAQVAELAERLVASLCEPVRFNDHELHPTVSIGIALAPRDGGNPERLLKSADLALYRSKADGRNCYRFFQPEMDAEVRARAALEQVLRTAVQNESFELHYQPVFAVAGRRLIGFEALLRLTGPDGTQIPPSVFIPVAEELRLIDRLGAWVLREACRAAATWPKHLTVAVNLSPAQFASGAISELVADALAGSALEPHRLELEITESLLLGHGEKVNEELAKLKAMGVAVVMDDFGTGYSSLSYLWRFPFDKIKIDRSFMLGLDQSGRDAQTVVKTIVALGRELNMHVTVEGVETEHQAAFLDDIDADQVQGFYFGRPVPAAELAGEILASFAAGHGEGAAAAAGGRKIKALS